MIADSELNKAVKLTLDEMSLALAAITMQVTGIEARLYAVDMDGISQQVQNITPGIKLYPPYEGVLVRVTPTHASTIRELYRQQLLREKSMTPILVRRHVPVTVADGQGEAHVLVGAYVPGEGGWQGYRSPHLELVRAWWKYFNNRTVELTPAGVTISHYDDELNPELAGIVKVIDGKVPYSVRNLKSAQLPVTDPN